MTLPPFFGAYSTLARPIEHLGLAVRVAPYGVEISLAQPAISFRGSVDAECLASGAPFDGRVSVDRGRLRVKLVFCSDAGTPHELDLVWSLAHPTVRSITALAGPLLCLGEPMGHAQVRIDWRRSLGR